MSDKKQTAVQWLRGEAIKLVVEAIQGTLNKDTLEHQIRQIVTKAMAMEREQMGGAFISGGWNWETPLTFSEYYKAIYGGQDESNN
jgi:hypothetical protein